MMKSGYEHPMETTLSEGPFTWTRKPSCEDAVREDCGEIIRSLTRSLAPGLDSIYLFGSFALGEGFLFRAGERWMADAPYRILIVPTTEPFAKERIEGLRHRLCRELHNPGLDFHQIPFFQIKEFPPGLVQTDIRLSALLLWGNPGALLRFTPYPTEDIPLLAGEGLLSDGARELLLACPERGGAKPDLPASLHAGRAIFSLASAILIPLGKYHPSLRVRGRRVREEFASFPSLTHLFGESIHFHKNPGDDFGLEHWLFYRTAFLQGVLRFLNWLYAFGMPFANLQHLISFHSNLFREEKSKASLRIGLSLLLAYPGKREEDKRLVRFARQTAAEIGTVDAGGTSWDEAVEQVLSSCLSGHRQETVDPEAAGQNQDQGRQNDG